MSTGESAEWAARLGLVAVVIPARSEAATVGGVVSDARSVLSSIGAAGLVVVVDDQSQDETRAIARALGATLDRVPPAQAGLASAFRRGVSLGLEAGASTFVCLDADGQYAAHEMRHLLKRIANGADLALGNRVWRLQPGMTASRRLSNIAFSALATIGLPTSGLDLQCGFRAFSADTARSCMPQGAFTYTQEQVVLAARARLQVESVNISFMPRVSGSSRLVKSTAHYATRVIPDVLRARFDARSAKFPPNIDQAPSGRRSSTSPSSAGRGPTSSPASSGGSRRQ